VAAHGPRRRRGRNQRSRLTGCSKVINAIKTAHNVLHEGAAISSLSNKLKSADNKPYEVSYVTTAKARSRPSSPNRPERARIRTTVSNEIVNVIQNSKGEFACSRS